MTDLFAEDLAAVPEVDPTKDYLEELVGDGRKYSDTKELAKANVYKDAHIKRLEAEAAARQRELDQRINMEKFLDQLNVAKSQLNQPDPQGQVNQPTDKSAPTPEQFEQLVATKLNELDMRKTAQQNTDAVTAKLREVYGPSYVQKLRHEASNLNMTDADIQNLAARNPKALYKLLGIGEDTPRETFTPAPRTQVNSFSLPSGPKKGYSWYWNNIYKNPERGPTEFYSAKVMNEMSQAMETMGKEAFLNS